MSSGDVKNQLRRVKELLEAKTLVRDHLAYTRRMFVEAEGSPFDVRPHHKIVCDQFDKVFTGECKRLIINIPPGYSKAIDCDTPMWTQRGWVDAGDIKIDDKLIGACGQWTNVKGVFPQGIKPAYDVLFNDGSSIVACGDHKWAVRLRDTNKGKKSDWVAPWRIKTTDELIGDIKEADGRKKWRIPTIDLQNTPDIDLPIDPYLLGCWLGDGHSYQAAITTMDAEIIEAFGQYEPRPQKHQNSGQAITYRLLGFVKKIRLMNLLGSKHIPDIYKKASKVQRWALLQGLMDTDGTCNKINGQISFCQKRGRLADDFHHLAVGLGCVVRIHKMDIGANLYGLTLPIGQAAFRLKRKLDNVKPRRACNTPRRFIESITPVYDRHMVCFHVDSDDHLFAAGKDMVITHNTELGVINFVGRGYARNPKARFIHSSYAEKLVFDNSSRIKSHIAMPAYQARWPVQFKADSTAKGLWRTSAGGHFLASPAGGPITGFRAGYLNARNLPEDTSELEDYELENMQDDQVFTGALLIDDPLKPDDAKSDALRKHINDRWENTFRSRLAHKDVPVVVIMQRLHVDDFVAHLLENSGEVWDVVSIPVMIEKDIAPFDLGPNANVIEYDLPEGPLWPQKADVADINILKLNKPVYNSQYQQRPIVVGGNVFKDEHFGKYKINDRPNLKRRLIIADTASKTKERNDYSVFGCFGLDSENNCYLLDLMRGKWEAPDLVEVATKFYDKHKALPWNIHGTLMGMRIEDKSSGTGLIQTMRRSKLPVSGVQVETDKYTKALGVIPTIAVSPVLLPDQAPWVDDFLNEMLAFPDGLFDDQCDVLMMGVMELMMKAHNLYDQM